MKRKAKRILSALLAVVMVLSMVTVGVSAAVTFKDVNSTDWFYPYVTEAAERGLMSGIGDNQFDPYGTTTRAMFVQILYAMAGKPEVSINNPFSDVPQNEWYAKAVQWAYENGVTGGTGDHTFSPNANVTREQIAVFLYAYAGKPAVSGDLSGFADAAKVSGWAKKPMIWATKNGIISGSSEGGKLYLNPLKNATRAETATMMVAFDNFYSAVKIWIEFLKSGAYEDYTSNGWDASSHEYAIVDVNSDKIPELLIQTTTDRPFYNTWLFTLRDKEVVCVFETYGYGSFEYSPTYNAVIVSPEWKPFGGNSYYPFYRLQETTLNFMFAVGQNEGHSFYEDTNGSRDISDEERAAYFANVVRFDWQKIPTTLVNVSDKPDLSIYLGTDIYAFGRLFNGSVGEAGTDGTIAYRDNGMYVAQGPGADSIDYIELYAECEYSIRGIECGMSVENAANIAWQSAISIKTDKPYCKSYLMGDNTTITIYAQNEEIVDGVVIYTNY